MILTFFIFFIGNVVAMANEKRGDDLAAKTQNPVGAMYSLPFKFTFDYGPDNGEATFLNIQSLFTLQNQAKSFGVSGLQ